MVLAKEQVMNLSGSELDEMVALAQGWIKSGMVIPCWVNNGKYIIDVTDYHPSTNGTQCMEIMEREKIDVSFKTMNGNGRWLSCIDIYFFVAGKTPMEAACRCFVLSKLEAIKNINQ